MKKLLISLLIFLASTFFINNVSALTSYDFTTAYEYKADLAYVWLENGEYKSEIVDESVIERIKNYMDSRGSYYMILLKNNFSSSNPNPYYDQYYTYIQVIEYVNSSSIPTISLNYEGALITGTFKSFNINANHDSYDSSVNSIDNYISQLENISISDVFSSGQDSYLVYPNWVTSDIPPNRSGATAIYYANFDIIYHNDSESDIVIGDYTISDGDEFITLSDYKQLTEEENEDDEVVYDFPNIEPLEGFERYAVISTNYDYNSGGTSATGEPNYYLLYFNQNFTYDGNSSRELLWPDNTNLSSVNLLLYSISNNSWQPLITNLVYFAFPGAYSAASYDTNVVYSNFDIYYIDSDEIYFKSSIDSPSEPIDYQYKASATTNEESPYYVEYKMLSGVVENYKKFDYKISSIQERDGYYDVPSTPRLELYKIVSDEYVLVEDDTISYTYREEFTDNTYYLIGDIKFSDDIVYSDDYVLRFVFDEIDNAKLDFYDSASLTFWGCYSSFLDGYTLYTFPDGYDYAFISKSENIIGNIYLSNNNDSSVSNYTNTNYLEVRDYDYVNKKYTLILPIEYIGVNDLHKYLININHDQKNIIVIKQYRNEDANNVPTFYVPNVYTVKFASFNENDGSIVTDIYNDGDDSYLYETPDGNIASDSFFGSSNDSLSTNGFDDKVKSWVSYINDYITNSTETINYVSSIIQMFFNDMPVWLNTFCIIAWIFILLKVTIVLGGWK